MVFRVIFFLLSIFITLFSSCKSNTEEQSILLYCAAGMKPVLEEVSNQYYKEYGIRVNLQYGGSGTLLSNLRIAQQGDLYLAADKSYIDEAKSHNLIAETQPLAFIKPIIAVAKGNPKNIVTVSDLLKEDIKLSIANPDAASVGRLTKKMLKQSKVWDSIQDNITVLMPTVNEVANTIKLGSVDAGIIWDAVANQYNTIENVEIDSFNACIKNITIGVLKYSKQPKEALRFLRYLSSKDKGLQVFDKLGYKPIDGDVWQEKPEIVLFSGGVNRLAVDKTITDFEEREGILVTRVYNGCGILVSQIKAGQNPDAYLTCDVTFMDQVEEQFTDIIDISNTKIVIATKKGNPKNIKSLKDLTQDNLKLGVCNHDQSALGALTKNLLDEENLWEAVYKNVRSQTPTADLLVNQIITGSLDAVIVYNANVNKVREKLDIVSIDLEKAIALQNVGIKKDSDNKYLTQRLIEALTTAQSKAHYLENGFGWEVQ